MRRAARALAGSAIILWSGGCGDDLQGPGGVSNTPDAPSRTLSALIVSDPVASADLAGTGLSSSSTGIVFVSLPPGIVPDGEHVVIRNRGTAADTTAVVMDGGFGPVPLAATAGDTLDVRIGLGEGELLEVFAVAPARKSPVVVRTQPPFEQRGVGVNVVMLVVFSEPIDPATLTASSLQLQFDGTPVPGALGVEAGGGLTVHFTPVRFLDPGTDYTLLITREIRDLHGDAIASQLRVDFRTTGTPPPRIELLLDVTDELAPPDPPTGSVPIAAGLFMSVSRIRQAEATDRARRLIAETNDILRQCALHLVVEAAHVVSLPPHLLAVQGNEIGSWGGHPPDSLGDPDLVMYQANERLTKDTRDLFAYGKHITSPNATGIFIVDEIEYYIGAQLTGAAGLSFPPVIYHHPEDYPLRNSVLATGTGGRLIAHELGHMLLNTGDHWGEGSNLMLAGSGLTSDQCDRMRENRERLFGDDAVPDPGPPKTEAITIAMASGNGQVGKAGEALELPFAIRVTDDRGERVAHVHTVWRVTAGAGHFPGRAASRTDHEGIADMSFVPTAVGTSTVTAEVAGLRGSPVTFSIDAPTLVITLRPAFIPWLGFSGDPVFSDPEGGSDVTVPVATVVEWSVFVETAHIASTSEPPGGQPFDSGMMNFGQRLQFVPGVAGVWEFEDLVSGATGRLTVQ